jgi:hypothetical protein
MKKLLLATTVAFWAAAGPAGAQVVDDPLHGFCAAGCADNGTNTPITSNPPVNFGFTISPGPQTGDLVLDILVPNTAPVNPANTVTITGSTVPGGSENFALFSTTAWTSGFLDTYLGLSASPSNPIDAYLPSTQALGGSLASATGFFVLQADLGTQTLSGPSGPFSPTFTLNRGAEGMYVVGFFDGNVATANSGALFETGSGNTINPVISPVPGPIVGAGLPGMIAGCMTLLGLGRWRRKRHGVVA